MAKKNTEQEMEQRAEKNTNNKINNSKNLTSGCGSKLKA
jgi:hypothetical protein